MSLATDERVGIRLRRSWFCQVAELADIGLQRRTWLDKENRNPHWSYIEFACSYPDDEQFSYALKHGWLSNDEFETLTELGRVVSSYSPPEGHEYDNAAVLDDPDWHCVVKAAAAAKGRLLSMTADQHEREILSGTA